MQNIENNLVWEKKSDTTRAGQSKELFKGFLSPNNIIEESTASVFSTRH